MHARFWLALACAMGGALVWWIAAREDGVSRVVAHAATLDPVAAPAPAELTAAPSHERLEPAPAASREVDAPESRPESRRVLETSPAPVSVRVQLALASEAPGSFDGWLVEAQSWLEHTDETFLHEARASAKGVAEFSFPGFVHIDWLRCVPPPESGLALAFAEHHADLDPGDSLEETLELDLGGVLGARVVDTDGRPVAEARVHAYSEGVGYDLTSWQPGLVAATTGADGRVEFPPLPPGDWCLGVEPERWLQIEPDLNSGACSEVQARVRAEDRDIEVVPLHRFRLSVRDALGRPVEAAEVQLAPLELRALATRTPEPLEFFLGHARPPEEGAAPRVWPYDTLVWTTDAQGEAELFGIEGRWELGVVPQLGRGQGQTGELIRSVLELPCPDQTVRLPAAVQGFHARVQDAAGRPIEGVEAALVRTANGVSVSTTSARDGSFELRGLQPGVECRLELSHRDYLPGAWSVWTTAAAQPPVFELRRAGAVSVRMTDTTEKPLQGRGVAVLALLPDEPAQPAESAWLARHPHGARFSDGAGRIQFTQLPPGRVELGLQLPFATNTSGPAIQRVTMELFQRWVLPVQEGEQTLRVDLGRYVPPAPRQVPHTGVVLDADSGAPLDGVWVFARSATGQSRVRTDGEGRFNIAGVSSPLSLTLLGLGYLPLEVPEQECAPGVHEHRLALRPGGHAVTVEFLDRDGVRLPRLEVAVKNEDGASHLGWMRTGSEPFFSSGQRVLTDGRLVLESQAEGRVRFELSIAGHALGSGAVEVGGGRAPEAASVRLEQSLAEMRAEIERALGGDEDGEGED